MTLNLEWSFSSDWLLASSTYLHRCQTWT